MRRRGGHLEAGRSTWCAYLAKSQVAPEQLWVPAGYLRLIAQPGLCPGTYSRLCPRGEEIAGNFYALRVFPAHVEGNGERVRCPARTLVPGRPSDAGVPWSAAPCTPVTKFSVSLAAPFQPRVYFRVSIPSGPGYRVRGSWGESLQRPETVPWRPEWPHPAGCLPPSLFGGS